MIAIKDIEKEIKVYQARDNKINETMKFCLMGDKIASYVLGIEPSEWNNICAKGKYPAGCDHWDEELKAENCSIAYIKTLDNGSISHIKALRKLRAVVKRYMPYIE